MRKREKISSKSEYYSGNTLVRTMKAGKHTYRRAPSDRSEKKLESSSQSGGVDRLRRADSTKARWGGWKNELSSGRENLEAFKH